MSFTETQKYVESLQKIYLVACWVRYGVRDYPFTGKFNEDGIPLVYDFTDHNGTYGEYIITPITEVTTGEIDGWYYSEFDAKVEADICNMVNLDAEPIYFDIDEIPSYEIILHLIGNHKKEMEKLIKT